MIALAAGAIMMVPGCGSKEPTTPQSAGAPAPDAPAAETAASGTLAHTAQAWTAEALEALLAPIALYPDPVLSQILAASTNPQEVLDAGNWLVLNPELKGRELDKAAADVGFTPPMRALMQFRQTVDMMCMEMGWTTELGQAFTNDESGVLAAVQRLRLQAMEVGNLKTSSQMTVSTQIQGDQQAILIQPPNREVIYVPQYDPVAAYAPATPTTTEEHDDSGTIIATGLLAFGAGLLIADWIHDDDYYYHGYPNYWGGHVPRPTPYRPYRPVYGGGYRPGYSYNRPVHYENNFNNNNVVIVSKNPDYWNKFDNRSGAAPRAGTVQSPITAVRSNRQDLARVSSGVRSPGQGQPRPATATRPAEWSGQSGYAGARPEVRQQAKLPPASSATSARAAANAASARTAQSLPGADRGYAGAERPEISGPMQPPKLRPEFAGSSMPATTPAGRDTRIAPEAAQPRPSREVSMPARPAPSVATRAEVRPTAMSGSDRGDADRMASQRGRSSMPAGGGGGGGRGGRR